MRKKITLTLVAVVICLLTTIKSFSQIENDKYFEMNKAIETFGSVFKSLHSNYVDEINSGDLVKTAIDAMLAKLDPYTNFYPESDMEDVKLTFTDGALKAVAKKAIERKTGARGLRAIMEEALLELMYEIPDKKDIAEIVIDDKVINDKKAPKFIKARENKKAV